MNIALLLELFLTFLKIGIVMFGGGYAMIPILRYEVVVKKQWVTEQEFIDIIAIAESTPGPIAINSATYIGYKVAGVIGSTLATLAVVLPSFVIILGIATILLRFYQHYIVRGILNGIRGAVIGLILSAVFILVRGIVKSMPMMSLVITFTIAMAVFACVLFLDLDPVILVAVSAFLGLILTIAGIW